MIALETSGISCLVMVLVVIKLLAVYNISVIVCHMLRSVSRRIAELVNI